MAPSLSILIVTWNCRRNLQRLLASIQAMDFADFEIVVIDNASKDGTVEHLRRYFPEIRLITNTVNVGQARAVNQGLRLIDTEYVLTLDSDTEVAPAAVSRLMRFLAERPDVALVAPRLYDSNGNIEESARNFPTVWNGLFGRRSVLTRLFPRNPFSERYLVRENLSRKDPFPVEQVSAACMLLRRSLIAEIGPWDEGFRVYFVDTDWCRRLRKHGKRIYCIPEATVVHHEQNRAGKKKKPSRIWMFHQGAFRLYRKHDTFGRLDPRTWLAFAILSARAGAQILVNLLRRDSKPEWRAASPRTGVVQAVRQEKRKT